MRANEFLAQNMIPELQAHFATGLNDYLQETSQVFESTTEINEVITFLREYINNPIIGNKYFITTLSLSPIPEHKFMSVATIQNKCKLIDYNDEFIIVQDIVSGRRRQFPEVLGPVFSKTMKSVLFDLVDNQEQFITMLLLRFGHWEVNQKTL